MLIKLFTKKDCPKCPPAKLLIKEITKLNLDKLMIEKFDVETTDGMAEAAYYTVMSTPTILVCSNKGNVLTGWYGEVPSKEVLFKSVDGNLC